MQSKQAFSLVNERRNNFAKTDRWKPSVFPLLEPYPIWLWGAHMWAFLPNFAKTQIGVPDRCILQNFTVASDMPIILDADLRKNFSEKIDSKKMIVDLHNIYSRLRNFWIWSLGPFYPFYPYFEQVKDLIWCQIRYSTARVSYMISNEMLITCPYKRCLRVHAFFYKKHNYKKHRPILAKTLRNI